MNQWQLQALGLSLAAVTAFGCIAYERLVKGMSYFTVGALVSLSYIPFWLASLYWSPNVSQDFSKLKDFKWSIVVFILSGATGPIWYYITRSENVVTGAVFELKYIFLLVVFYTVFGTTKLSWNTVVGALLAAASIYFITKK